VKVPRIILWLVIALAAVLLVATKAWPTYQSFVVGAPLFARQDAKANPGSELGSLHVRPGHYYLLSVQTDAVSPFTIFFTYQDGEKSKVLIDDPRYVGPDHPYQSVIKVDREDAAAQITVGRYVRPWPQAITLRRLSVSEFNPHLYLWRKVLRVGAMLAMFAASVLLVWGWLSAWRRPVPAMASETDTKVEPVKSPWDIAIWRVKRVGFWATLLLVLGTGCDGYYVGYQHSQLLTKTFHSSITGWDGSFYYFWLRSIMVDGDIDFANDLLYCNTMPPDYRRAIVATTPRTATGLIPDKYPIGWSLLEVPWYIGADLTAQFVNWYSGEGRIPYDGFGEMYQVFLVFGQIVYATASLYFACRILLEYLPPAFAACGLVLGWLGSPLFFYQTIDVIMSHNVMFFSMTAVYYCTYRLRERPDRWGRWCLVGAFSACVILSRYQGAIMLLFPGVVCLQEVGKNWRRWPGLLVAMIAGAIPLSLQMIAWKVMYGSFFLYTYQHETFSWLHPHLFEVLFSPFHGLFNWHPMMLVGFLGFLAWAVRSRRYTDAACFTLSLLLAIYINAAWDNWWFGASFGSRPFDTCTLFSMLGVGYLLSLLVERAAAFQTVAVALLLLAIWSMNLMWMSLTGRLPFEKPVTWKQRIDMTVHYWSRDFLAK
jgi:hypothetical protein